MTVIRCWEIWQSFASSVVTLHDKGGFAIRAKIKYIGKKRKKRFQNRLFHQLLQLNANSIYRHTCSHKHILLFHLFFLSDH